MEVTRLKFPTAMLGKRIATILGIKNSTFLDDSIYEFLHTVEEIELSPDYKTFRWKNNPTTDWEIIQLLAGLKRNDL